MPNLKLDEEGHVVVEDGKPVYAYEDGTEKAHDLASLLEMGKRTAKKRDALEQELTKAQSVLDQFDGMDAVKAREALDKVRNLDDKKLVEAGKVDEAVQERVKDATERFEREREKLQSSILERDAQLDRLVLSNRFAGTVALEGTIFTPDLAESRFGSHFVREGEQIVPYKRPPRGEDPGEKLYGDDGELADFDTALKQLITSNSNWPKWQRSSGATGGDAPGSGSGGSTRSVGRSQFEGMSPKQQMDYVKEGGAISETA